MALVPARAGTPACDATTLSYHHGLPRASAINRPFEMLASAPNRVNRSRCLRARVLGTTRLCTGFLCGPAEPSWPSRAYNRSTKSTTHEEMSVAFAGPGKLFFTASLLHQG